LRELKLTSFDDYYALVTSRSQGNHPELEHLLNAITTNKTSFFRESHHFDVLRRCVVAPSAEAGGQPKLRIWSAGCSTGEEPYSILMTICEALPHWEGADVRVLASDLDSEVLATGERGVYPREHTDELPAELRRRWFIEGSGNQRALVRVRRALRERVAFRRINFVEPDWPVRVRFDAIFCRNALIYFDSETQRTVVGRLLSYLLPNGYLFLGHSESMAGARPELKSLGRTAYQYLGEP
ncbi:MAG TPA: protein-glutamate O-methyltransferase CheR, partial [Polyangiaceae bacterium]|nr:protein-glutamate O-methyltransferase CheR [Polyangiaceae bacterium]